jgi:uncharacterized membrane protein YvbJ
MQCRQCGTEIADKAIVCFRCGHATTDPVRRAVVIKKRRSPLASFAAILLLVLLALYMGYASQSAQDPGRLQLLAGLFASVALVLVIIRLVRRR